MIRWPERFDPSQSPVYVPERVRDLRPGRGRVGLADPRRSLAGLVCELFPSRRGVGISP